MAALTSSLTRLRTDFNTRFPNRDKASDGWIGDKRHQLETSGHNPDETGGGEYEDADSKDEVRAIDVDIDFRDVRYGATARDVINSFLSTPADLARLEYIIYNRQIWSQNTGWKPRPYTGSNPHDKHIHFSGRNPKKSNQDENAAPWQSVLKVKIPPPPPPLKPAAKKEEDMNLFVRVDGQAAVYEVCNDRSGRYRAWVRSETEMKTRGVDPKSNVLVEPKGTTEEQLTERYGPAVTHPV